MSSLWTRFRNVITDEISPADPSRERQAGREDIAIDMAVALDRMAERIRSEWARELAAEDTPSEAVSTHFQAQILAHTEVALAVHSLYNAGLVDDVRLPEILHPEAVERAAIRHAELSSAASPVAREMRAELEYGPALLTESVTPQERQKAPEIRLERGYLETLDVPFEREQVRDYGMEMGL